jgi:beta-carotene 15,15'-dioxygenase
MKLPENALSVRLLCLAIVFAMLIAVALVGRGVVPLPNWLLVAVVLLLGVPHGALDFVKARQQLALHLMLVYILVYVALTAFSLYALAQFPWLILPTLLAIASWHFGETYQTVFFHADFVAPQSHALRAVRVIGAFAVGALPISLTIFAQPIAAQVMFTAIAGAQAAQVTLEVWQAGSVFFTAVPLLALIFGIWRIVSANKDNRRTCLLDFLEILFTFVIFLFAPPLLAFSVYFCFIHAPRHTAIALQEIGTSVKSWPLMLEALVVSLVAVALIFGLYTVFLPHGDGIASDLVSLMFAGLLSITVAHAAHDRLCRLLS